MDLSGSLGLEGFFLQGPGEVSLSLRGIQIVGPEGLQYPEQQVLGGPGAC